MLAGIKTGKKKKRKDPPPPSSSAGEPPSPRTSSDFAEYTLATTRTATATRNDLVADEFRQRLKAGQALSSATAEQQQQQGIVTTTMMPPAVYSSIKNTPAEDWTVQEMLSHEKKSSSNNNMSLAEQEARNVLRLGKRRKLKLNKQQQNYDSDEEEERQLRQTVQQQEQGDNKNKAQARFQHRQLALHDRQEHVTRKCWWWMESISFASHLLLSVGQSVTLLLAPANRSLVPGQHFYLVPIPHAESLAGCDETVWNEIRQFQASLRALFKKDNYRLVYFETVLSTSSSSSFWQTRLEAVALPNKDWQEAPFYFQSSLQQVAQEISGTHQKVMKTSCERPLYRTVPRNNKFDYFFVEYDDERHDGFVQMIENNNTSGGSHEKFSSDFAVDTLAGITGQDLVRFKRKQKQNVNAEQRTVQEFQARWKAHDWTRQRASCA